MRRIFGHINLIQILISIWCIDAVYSQLPKLNLPKKGDSLLLPPCKACTVLIESFQKGLEKTARGKHEGGDAAWAEEKLQSYSRSELRLTEIQEGLCNDSKFSDQCHSLAEKVEHIIEDWWLNRQEAEADLHSWLCIKELAVCCPPNHYGSNCNQCTDCNGNGKCKGNGTRRGNGKCACSEGYDGESCNQCAIGYYESFRDETKLLCSICHVSCNAEHGCNSAGPNGCRVCENGWYMEPERGGCVDVNECAQMVQPCTSNQFCVNSDGSYSCLECDKSCNGCSGDGPDLCKECTDGYEILDGLCTDVGNESRKSRESFYRYITYFGLCVATVVIFQSSTWLAAAIGVLVACYISLSEYWLKSYVGTDTANILKDL